MHHFTHKLKVVKQYVKQAKVTLSKLINVPKAVPQILLVLAPEVLIALLYGLKPLR